MTSLSIGRFGKTIAAFSTLLFLVTGCSSVLTYSEYAAGGESEQSGLRSGEREWVGYWEEKLDQGVYSILFAGKAGEPDAITAHWAFKRAAELTRDLGKAGFAVIGMETRLYRFSTKTTYQSFGEFQQTTETTTHKLPYTKFIVMMADPIEEGSDTSFLFNPERVLSWYEAAEQRHRENNSMFDVRGVVERHFTHLNEEDAAAMRSIANSPPKDVHWWEAGLADGDSRIFFAIDTAGNVVTHLWVDGDHLTTTFEDSRYVWADGPPGDHLMEIAAYTIFWAPDDPRKSIDEARTLNTKEGEIYLVSCPPKFGSAKGSFVTDRPDAIKADVLAKYVWE